MPSFFRSQRRETVELLEKLVRLESPSADKKAVDRCSDAVISELKKAGAEITTYPQKGIGDLYLAEYPGLEEDKSKGKILVLTHADTVWPVGTIKTRPFRVLKDRAYGPGVLDMKAGLVMAVFVLRAFGDLQVKPRRRVAVFINSAEEISHPSPYGIVKDLAKDSSAVLCLEPCIPGGALKMQRKGRLVVRLEAIGKAAHAGTPEQGVNAIEELLHQLGRLRSVRTKAITMSIGLIEGGERANIVASRAAAVLDLRFWTTTQEVRILDHLRHMKPHYPGAKIESTVESQTPPMEKTKASMRMFSKIRTIAASLGMSIEAGKAGGGSDASIASQMGVPTVDGLGPDGRGIHAENEYVDLSSLVQRTALFSEILTRL